MTKVLIIQSSSLESYYEQTLDYLHAKYHTYPTNLSNIHVDADTVSKIGYYERMAQNIADKAKKDKRIPLGKLVL